MLNFEEQLQKIHDAVKEGKSDVALIDDDETFSFMLKDYLQTSAELKTDLYTTGEAFLKDFKQGDKRIIILDYHFQKGMDGPEILKKIKSVSPSTIVIIVSAQDDLEKAMVMLRNGAADYFLKTNKTVFANILCSLMKIIEMEKHRWN
jgi:DNA-binding NtrC family response regulator